MTTKEAIHRLVDALDEQAAVSVLDYVQMLSREEPPTITEQRPLEWLSTVQPTMDRDPLGDLIGIISDDDDGPTDVGRNHDVYLAEAYEDWKRR